MKPNRWYFTRINWTPRHHPTWMLVVSALLMLMDGLTGLMMAPFRRYGTLAYSDWCVYTIKYGIEVRKRQRAATQQEMHAYVSRTLGD